MSDALHWTDVVVAVAAVIAIIISIASAATAWTARKDSKKSADAAEKSAYESKAARKIAQADILVEHFDNAAYLWEPIFEKVGRDESKIRLGKQSIVSLKIFLAHDAEFLPTLDWINTFIDQVPNGILEHYSRKDGNPPSYRTPANASALKDRFEAKRREYLNIG